MTILFSFQGIQFVSKAREKYETSLVGQNNQYTGPQLDKAQSIRSCAEKVNEWVLRVSDPYYVPISCNPKRDYHLISHKLSSE